jgi:hypothetical protein
MKKLLKWVLLFTYTSVMANNSCKFKTDDLITKIEQRYMKVHHNSLILSEDEKNIACSKIDGTSNAIMLLSYEGKLASFIRTLQISKE